MLGAKQQWCPRCQRHVQTEQSSPLLADRKSSSELLLPVSSVVRRYRAKQPAQLRLNKTKTLRLNRRNSSAGVLMILLKLMES